MRWIIVSGAIHNFNMYAINAFTPAYLMRYHGTDLRTAGFYTALAAGAAGIPGLLAGGWLADRFGTTGAAGRLKVGMVAVFLSTPLFWLALATPGGSAASFSLLLSAGMTLVFFYYSTVYAAIQDTMEPDIRGTAMAVYFFAMYLLGGALGPLAVGGLSDHFATRAALSAGISEPTRAALEPFRGNGLHAALWVVPIAFFALGLVLWASSRAAATEARSRGAAPATAPDLTAA
jgi:MFS family permease